MFLRTFLGGIVALPIMLSGAAHARDAAASAPASTAAPAIAFSMPSLRLPGAIQPAPRAAPVQYAQATDPRVAQLEEQVRQLTGTLEELNFQILQMQDQLRRMQEDNEIRFQELEQKRSDAGGAAPTQDRAAVGSGDGGSGGSGDDDYYAASPRVEDGSTVTGAPPRTFGTITFDENGNASGAGLPEQTDEDTTVAALPSGSGGDDELYRNSYEFILSGDYGTAETGFRDLLAQYPDSEHAADAHFWLGEALLAQQKPREAAEIFLAASRDYPQARKAPDTLFKLGVSLAALNQRDVACATFTEVLQRYPNTTDALRERIKQEQALASC